MPQPYSLRSPYVGPPIPGSTTPKATRRSLAGSGAGSPRAPSQERLSGGRAAGARPAAYQPPSSSSRARALPPGPGPLDERGRKLEVKGRTGRVSRDSVVVPSPGAKRTPLRADHSLSISTPSAISSTSSSSSSSPPSRRKASLARVGPPSQQADPCADLHEPQECLRRLSAARLRRSPSLGRVPSGPEPAPAPAPALKRSSSLRGLHQDTLEAQPGGGVSLRPVQLDILPGPSRHQGGTTTATQSRDEQNTLLQDHQQQQRRLKKQETLTIGTGLVGLRNLGNTCFMNAILQCLSHTQGLRDYCIHREYQLEGNGYGKKRCELMDAFANVISALWDPSSSGCVNPIQFQQKFQKFVPHFAGYSQQDAQEFLRFLMDRLHIEINRKTRKTPNIMSLSRARVSSDNMDRLRDDEKSMQMWKRYLERDDSKIVDLFVGQLNSTLRCATCGHKSTTFEVFCDLSLPIPKKLSVGGRVLLSECLSLFTAEEELDADNAPAISERINMSTNNLYRGAEFAIHNCSHDTATIAEA
ncbi:ubiquitin carboxyl-terminal hydrolase 21-like isoform X2 [Mustelus asterias]